MEEHAAEQGEAVDVTKMEFAGLVMLIHVHYKEVGCAYE